MASPTREERLAKIRAEVATWPRLTPERGAELRRLLGPAADQLRAQAAADEQIRKENAK